MTPSTVRFTSLSNGLVANSNLVWPTLGPELSNTWTLSVPCLLWSSTRWYTRSASESRFREKSARFGGAIVGVRWQDVIWMMSNAGVGAVSATLDQRRFLVGRCR